ADLKNGDNRQRLETLVSEVRSFEDRVEGSFLLRMKYLGSLSHYHVCIGDREQAFLAVSQQLEICEAHPLMLKVEGQLYKMALANYLTRAHSYRDFSRFEERLRTLKGLPTDTFYAEGEVFQNVYFIE